MFTEPQMSERKRKVRIGRLTTLGGILVEMANVYRQTRRGEIDDLHGVRLTSMLREMRSTIELSELEVRLQELEASSSR